MNKLIFIIFLILFLSPAMVSAANTAKITAYIIDPPHVSVNLQREGDILNCTWSAEDMDEEEELTAEIRWFKNGDEQLNETARIEAGREYSRTNEGINAGDKWECMVKVKDKFGTEGESVSSYMAPSGMTGFFSLNEGKLTGRIVDLFNPILKYMRSGLAALI